MPVFYFFKKEYGGNGICLIWALIWSGVLWKYGRHLPSYSFPSPFCAFFGRVLLCTKRRDVLSNFFSSSHLPFQEWQKRRGEEHGTKKTSCVASSSSSSSSSYTRLPKCQIEKKKTKKRRKEDRMLLLLFFAGLVYPTHYTIYSVAFSLAGRM